MDVTKVTIENWPPPNYLSVPIILAACAVLVSLCSIYLTRKSFIMSHRPFVWGINYLLIASDHPTPQPRYVLYRVKNSPAKIIKTQVKITLNEKPLFEYTDGDFVKFPDESSEWSFVIGVKKFDEIMNRSMEDKSKLVRLISLEYSSLEGGKIYHYDLEQSFEPSENQWKNTGEKAD